MNKTLSAKMANVGTFAAVCHVVPSQAGSLSEAGGAEFADERFLFGVGSNVVVEKLAVAKAFFAVRAGEVEGSGVFDFLTVLLVFSEGSECEIAMGAVTFFWAFFGFDG